MRKQRVKARVAIMVDRRKRVERRKRVGRKNKREMKQLVWLMGEKKTLKYRSSTMERSMTMNIHWKMTPQMMRMNPLC
jgi:IS30 family transposase